MNCSECGSALLLDRSVFHCPCGAYVHAYCADKHILQAHRPAFEVGHVDLNGDFHPEGETAPVAQLASFDEAAPLEEGEAAAEDSLEEVAETEPAPVEIEKAADDIDTTSELPSEEDTTEDNPTD